MPQQCPCGSNQSYNDCCAAIHHAPEKALHADQLMRARYSAHVVEHIDFILDTWHTSQRHLLDKAHIAQWSHNSEWLKLNVVATEHGTPYSYVTFIAVYRDGKEVQFHHEHSRFVFEQGRWWYLDGEASALRPSRNDACPCGSGKKFKKCDHSS